MEIGFTQLQGTQHVPSRARKDLISFKLGTVKWLEETDVISYLELQSRLDRVVADNE